MNGVERLDSQSIIENLRNALSSHQDTLIDCPTLELSNAWVNGSYGAGQETDASDIDITLEISVYTEEYESNPETIIDKIFDFSGPASVAISPIVPALPDVTSIPEKPLIEAAGWDVVSAWGHVQQTQNHGGYDLAYNIITSEYVPI